MPTTLTPNLDLFRSNKEITPLDEYNFNEFYWFPKKECMVIVALAILEQVLQENDEDQKPLFFWYGAITKRPLHMQNAPEELRPIILPEFKGKFSNETENFTVESLSEEEVGNMPDPENCAKAAIAWAKEQMKELRYS